MGPMIIALFLEFWYGTISKIVGFFAKPFFEFLVSQHLLDANYLSITSNFIFDNLIPKFKFARDVIINITGLPVQVFIILSNILLLSFGLYITFLALKFALNAWGLFRTGRSVGRSMK